MGKTNPIIKFFGYTLGRFMSDKAYLKFRYKKIFGKKLNLKNPQTFNEKLQWLKLYDRKPIYTTMVDKYAVKKYVADIIGDEYIIPTLGVWDKFDDIDFDKLPNQFVLKCTHDSGGLVIIKDKSTFDKVKAKKTIEKALKTKFYLAGRERPYKNVPRKIIAEQYMEDSETQELRDYKVLCFNGEPKLIQIHDGRYTNHTKDTDDCDWNRLDMVHGSPMSDKIIEKPSFLENMLKLTKILAKDLAHVRIDWYFVNNKLYFGEITFYVASGFTKFQPQKWDYELGSWIKIK